MIKVNKTVHTYQLIEADIKFPYIAWYDYKKTNIIQIFEPKSDSRVINYVIVQKGFGIDTSIAISTVSYINNTADNDFFDLINDFADSATLEEFNKFFTSALNDITNLMDCASDKASH